MYEPYGEEKSHFNLKEKFNQLKQKIQEKFKSLNIKGMDTSNLKLNKVTITAVALGLLVFIGGFTSYVTYTSKINDLESENLVLQKQNDACQSELNNINQQLSTCSADLGTIRSDLTAVTSDYQTTQSNLRVCNEEKLTLSSDLNLVNEEIDNVRDDYDRLENDYEDLEDDLENLECGYAKKICSLFDKEYYYLEDGEISCCSSKTSCDPMPDDEEKIKSINC